MKICHIVANLYAGGAQTFLVMLAIEQKIAGHDVTIFTLDKFINTPFESYLKNELSKHDIQYISLNRKPGKNISIFNSLLKLRKELLANLPDIINSHLPITHLTVAMCLKVMGLYNRLVLTIHSAPEIWNRQTLFFNKTTPSIYCSAASKQKSLKRDGLHTVIDNGIKSPYVNKNAEKILADFDIPVGNKLVLMVGNFSKVKNYPLAVKIASEYQNKHVSFLVCGLKLETYEQDIASFQTVNNIYYLGIKVPNDIYSLMGRCDCFLNTSTVEGLPITVLEALYIGIPCVLSPIQAHYQLTDNMPYSYIADNFEYGSFVKKIDEALSVDLTKDEIIELRNEQLKKYGIENSAKKYISFYKDVIASQKG